MIRVLLVPILTLLLAAGAAEANQGERLYLKACGPCHQAHGRGLPGVYPPLAGHLDDFLAIEGGRAYLVRAVTYGLWGAIVVDRRPYRGFMPPQPQLGEGELAAILNHIVADLPPAPADVQPYDAAEVARHRTPPAEGPSEIYRERQAIMTALEQRSEAQIPVITGTAQDYVRQCQGCHRADGLGAPGAVPRLTRFVGYFTHLAEGRAFLLRLPGVALAPIDDHRLAAVLNWTLETFSRDEMVPGFRPYTAAEAGRLRRRPLTEIVETRARLLERLRRAGVVPAGDDGLGPLPN